MNGLSEFIVIYEGGKLRLKDAEKFLKERGL
jgi:hypothetical protein